MKWICLHEVESWISFHLFFHVYFRWTRQSVRVCVCGRHLSPSYYISPLLFHPPVFLLFPPVLPRSPLAHSLALKLERPWSDLPALLVTSIRRPPGSDPDLCSGNEMVMSKWEGAELVSRLPVDRWTAGLGHPKPVLSNLLSPNESLRRLRSLLKSLCPTD